MSALDREQESMDCVDASRSNRIVANQIDANSVKLIHWKAKEVNILFKKFIMYRHAHMRNKSMVSKHKTKLLEW